MTVEEGTCFYAVLFRHDSKLMTLIRSTMSEPVPKTFRVIEVCPRSEGVVCHRSTFIWKVPGKSRTWLSLSRDIKISRAKITQQHAVPAFKWRQPFCTITDTQSSMTETSDSYASSGDDNDDYSISSADDPHYSTDDDDAASQPSSGSNNNDDNSDISSDDDSSTQDVLIDDLMDDQEEFATSSRRKSLIIGALMMLLACLLLNFSYVLVQLHDISENSDASLPEMNNNVMKRSNLNDSNNISDKNEILNNIQSEPKQNKLVREKTGIYKFTGLHGNKYRGGVSSPMQ